MSEFPVVIAEPLARSTGHQTWFAKNLVQALLQAGLKPTLITFDGMHDDADLELRGQGAAVHRILPLWPRPLRWLFKKITGISSGTIASPSAVRFPRQMYLYNQIATVVTVIYSCRYMPRHKQALLHLLCPPSWLSLWFARWTGRPQTRLVVTSFGAPLAFRGNSTLRRNLCSSGRLAICVQTAALAEAWAADVGAAVVHNIPLASGDSTPPGDVETCRRKLDLPLDKPIVAVVGCIAPQKGYVELYAALRGMEKDFRILLVGDTPAWVSPDPEDVAREAGWLDHTILRRAFLPEDLMPALFGAVNAVSVLYREPNGSSGILSLCQQYKVPVISTCFGELGAKVRAEHLGLTADPNDPNDVAQVLQWVLAGDLPHPTPATRASTLAPPGAWSWRDVAAAHLRLYAFLMGEVRQ